MTLNFSDWSIKKQFATLISIIVIIISIITVAFVSQFSAKTEINQTRKQLKSQIESVTNLLDLYYVSVEDKAKSLTNIFYLSLDNDFSIDSTELIPLKEEKFPALKAKNTILNNNFEKLDNFKKNAEGEFTIFLRQNDDFIRVSTTLSDNQGNRMIGTRLDKTGASYQALTKGESYVGRAKLFNKNYLTCYKPIKNAKGEVIGAVFAGFSYHKALADLRNYLQKTVIGETGYYFIIDAKKHPSVYGEFIVHPTHADRFVKDLDNPRLKNVLEMILQNHTGYLNYFWPNKNGEEQEKIAYYQYIDKWEWVIGGGSYFEEFVQESHHLRNVVIVILTIGGISISLSLYYFMGKRLKPLSVMAEAVHRIGAGDLSIRLKSKANYQETDNEIIKLSYQLQQTINNFRNLIQHILKLCQDLNQSTQNLTSVSNNILSNAEHQSDATSSTSASIEEMTQSIGSVAEHAQNAESVSQEAQVKASQGKIIIDKVASEISYMSQTVDASAQIVIQLGEKSNSISAIVNVIREIAEQTNLLALNAAIEAARAGESGKGFAVVADEVRKLAERTANATGDISKMISDIQIETKNAVEQMHKVNDQVRQGSELTKQAGHSITDITQGALQTLHAIQYIAHATLEQSESSHNISEQIEKIALMVSHTTTSIQSNNQATNDLQRLADQLSQMVNKFKI